MSNYHGILCCVRKSVHTIKFTHRRILQVNMHKHTAKIIMENTKNHVIRNLLPAFMETFQQNVFIISNKVIRIVTHLNLEYPTPELQGMINTHLTLQVIAHIILLSCTCLGIFQLLKVLLL